ncbi:MAG: hypothetical protein ACE5NM_06540 [Sedimentisphaerales bacterium]
MAKALGVAFDRDYYFDPEKRYVVDCKCNEYAAEHFPNMRLFYSESNLGQIDYWDKDQIQIGGIQPNLILGILLGADFIPHDNYDADITPGCLVGKNLADLPPPETLLNHKLIKLFDEQIRQVQSDPHRQLRAIPPFFWDVSGRATIHGAMTSAQKFFGETFFIDMLGSRGAGSPTKPPPLLSSACLCPCSCLSPGRRRGKSRQQDRKTRGCLEIMQWIADAFIVLCQHFSQIANLPITSIHVGECSACIVSPELIEDFVVPTTSKIGHQLGPIRLHSCGPSTNHLEAFSKIANLHCLDLGGDTSIKKVREIFGKEMSISVAALPDDMSAESTAAILRWAKRIVEENDGGNLEYVYHLEPHYNINNIYALTDFVKSLS